MCVIIGIVDNSVGDDKKVLSILSYANGPGFYNHLHAEYGNVSRMKINGTDFTSFDVRQVSISSTLYVRVFCPNFVSAACMYVEKAAKTTLVRKNLYVKC